MFSKVLVKPTGIFLILRFYISATSATPIEQPGASEAQNITDDIHARADYNPYQCADPYIWLRRECLPISPTAWQDVCAVSNYITNYRRVYQNKPGDCGAGYTCFNGFNLNRDRFIDCVPNDTRAGKRKLDPQGGTSEPKRARVEVGNTQFEYSAIIDHDMTGAAVSAVLENEDATFLIAPNNVIVGNVHGRVQEVCHGDKRDPVSARNCYPKGTYDFTAGQTIDFTWGMTSNQVGKLVYGIMPAL